jgi:hypothetical protein
MRGIGGGLFRLSLTATCQGGTVSLTAGLSTYNRPAADCLQRPLRARFRQQLKAGVRRYGMLSCLIHLWSALKTRY